MTIENKLRIVFLIGTIGGSKKALIEYHRQIKATEPITGKILEKCIRELQSTETRLNNLIGTATTETENRSLSADETPVFRSVKDEDDRKEK
jgi:hypothetical protein